MFMVSTSSSPYLEDYVSVPVPMMQGDFRALIPARIADLAKEPSLDETGLYATYKAPSAANVTINSHPATNISLVILIGGLRAGEQAWETLYENVLDANSADLALMTSREASAYPNSSLFERSKYVFLYEQYDDWSDAVDLVKGASWRTTHLPKFKTVYPESEEGKKRMYFIRRYQGAPASFGNHNLHDSSFSYSCY